MDETTVDELRRALNGLTAKKGGAGAWGALPSLARLSERDMELDIDLDASRAIGAPLVIARPGPAPAPALDALTPRQREVARLIADGRSNAQIAHVLGISIATTKDHVHAILTRLGLARRHQIIAAFHAGTLAGEATNEHPSEDG